MPTIQSIRTRRARGETISEIVAAEGVSPPTVRKYLATTDFLLMLPAKQVKSSILDRDKGIVEGYLDEDERSWHKQRHSAKCVHERLVKEHSVKVGYTAVCIYVKKRREERRPMEGQYLKLVWVPEEAQVDFGEVDSIIYGQKKGVCYLVAVFFLSSMGLAQVLYGENAECVCRGLLSS